MFRALAVFEEYAYLDIDDPDVRTFKDAQKYAEKIDPDKFTKSHDTEFKICEIARFED